MELTDRQVSEYLALLGCSRRDAPDLPWLNHLIYRHQCSVPFSSLDIYHTDTPPDLSIRAVFSKVVERRRGGYCFELNLLFERLLTALGYQARAVAGKAVLGRTEELPLNHQAILVTIDGQDHYVDVGFGGPIAAGALVLQEGTVQRVNDERYRLSLCDKDRWAIDRVTGGPDSPGEDREERIRTEIEFYTTPVQDEDIAALNIARSAPGTLFYERRLLNLRTAGGRRQLDETVLTIVDAGVSNVIQLPDEAAIEQAACTYFNFLPR